ncbi:pre-mRNA processing RNA-helicase, partial [Nowakowskiella sp. JEL0078]
MGREEPPTKVQRTEKSREYQRDPRESRVDLRRAEYAGESSLSDSHYSTYAAEDRYTDFRREREPREREPRDRDPRDRDRDRDHRDSRDYRENRKDARQSPAGPPAPAAVEREEGEVVAYDDQASASRSRSATSILHRNSPPVVVALDPVDEKTRQRREKLDHWKKQKEMQQQLQDQETTKTNAISYQESSSTSPVKSDQLGKEQITTSTTQNSQQLPILSNETPSLNIGMKPAQSASTIKGFKSSAFLKATPKAPPPVPLARTALFDENDDEVVEVAPRRKMKLIPLSLEASDVMGKEIEPMEEVVQTNVEFVDDPLESFMVDVHEEVQKITEKDLQLIDQERDLDNEPFAMEEEDDEFTKVRLKGSDDESEIGSDPEDIIAAAAKKLAAKKKDLTQVDHLLINYERFRKDFFIEAPELAALTKEEVESIRLELDGIKIRGTNCPKPVVKWTQFGLPTGIYEVIRRVLRYEKPSPIQAQAIPAIMSGRDVIGIAKTGSGKTICFLLPMFRHIKDQRPLDAGEGPIGLIMTPTRELAVQIHKECKLFTKVLGLRAVCAYGGSPIKDQIDDLKRGAEIVICTPGRMIDLLCANRGRVTNLKRVTYMVLDESDRMFDLGFEPQVMKIVNNVRPTRQTVLFSATFPRQMEALARKILTKPLEITVGGRSIVADTITQHVEIHTEESKFTRLLEVLGKAFDTDPDNTKLLIFVERHESANSLLKDLEKRGYSPQAIHGGKDQNERDSTIMDFKTGAANVLIATSLAARGLDVKQLKVVVNYDCPNHMEDYVHRVGRTGRAGNTGEAYTFITADEDKFAVNIVKALKFSGADVPADVQAMADAFLTKVNDGKEKMGGSGFGGKGLDQLDQKRDMLKKIQKRTLAGELGEDVGDDDEEEKKEVTADVAAEIERKFEDKVVSVGLGIAGAVAAANAAVSDSSNSAAALAVKATQEAASKAAKISEKVGSGSSQDILARINAKYKEGQTSIEDIKRAAQQVAAAALGNAVAGGNLPVEAGASPFAYNIEINDFPQKARWRVTNKEQIVTITEMSGAAITTRGSYFPP